VGGHGSRKKGGEKCKTKGDPFRNRKRGNQIKNRNLLKKKKIGKGGRWGVTGKKKNFKSPRPNSRRVAVHDCRNGQGGKKKTQAGKGKKRPQTPGKREKRRAW